MKFFLTLHDRNGVELKEGDYVKIIEHGRFQFFCQITYLPKEQVIAPFHTFSFMSLEKVKSLPKEAIKSTEERYNIWYLPNAEEFEQTDQQFNDYLLEWRQCEHHLDKRCWRIKKVE